MSPRCGIIGHPVAHSLSPAFQRAAFAHCGLQTDYESWDTPAAQLRDRIANLRSPEYLGANVTIPHKEAVFPLLDELGGQSARVAAVNTIVNREGRLFGFNTDGPGFVAALRSEARFEPEGKPLLLLGAGGAARGIAFALAEARVERLCIANRDHARAERLASDITAAGFRGVGATPSPAPLAGYDAVVNCTAIGMHGGPAPHSLPADLSGCRPGTLVVDIVYAPEETPFLAAARAHGLPTLGGLPMLIYQGALAFELWTGLAAPVEVMFDAARRALAERETATRLP
ncbi:MAG: shikimate dehydrogenase [Tepidiformaceae bacterium]